jgi:hypothetical protein
MTQLSVDLTSELFSVGHSGADTDINIREAVLTLLFTNAAFLVRGFFLKLGFFADFFLYIYH